MIHIQVGSMLHNILSKKREKCTFFEKVENQIGEILRNGVEIRKIGDIKTRFGDEEYDFIENIQNAILNKFFVKDLSDKDTVIVNDKLELPNFSQYKHGRASFKSKNLRFIWRYSPGIVLQIEIALVYDSHVDEGQKMNKKCYSIQCHWHLD